MDETITIFINEMNVHLYFSVPTDAFLYLCHYIITGHFKENNLFVNSAFKFMIEQ